MSLVSLFQRKNLGNVDLDLGARHEVKCLLGCFSEKASGKRVYARLLAQLKRTNKGVETAG